MKNMMWTYLIHLGNNMWGDVDGSPAQNDFGEQALYNETANYTEKLLCDRGIFTDTVDFCAKSGINTLLIDLGEGVKYDSHPELAVEGSWSKQELKAELQRMRAMGITPIPKLNFSACHDAWLKDYRLMRCTDAYYRVREELIDEVSDLFDRPAYFHIGMDEENLACQRKMSSIFIRNEKLWWSDFYRLVDSCEKNNARAWCWSDYYWEHPEVFIKRMPKSVLQSNWRYEAIPEKSADGTYPNIGYQTYVDLNRLGYDQVPAGSCWSYTFNIEQTVLLALYEKFDPEHLYGFMAAPWLFCTERQRYGLLDNAHKLGLARKCYEERFR